MFQAIITQKIINALRPLLWKRYQKEEFRLKTGKRNTIDIPKWVYGILTFVGVCFVLTLSIGGMMITAIYMEQVHRLFSPHEINGGLMALAIVASFILGSITGIFTINTLSYFFYPAYIKADLVKNMTRTASAVVVKSPTVMKNKIMRTYDIDTIQSHDWKLMRKIWLITVVISICIFGAAIFV